MEKSVRNQPFIYENNTELKFKKQIRPGLSKSDIFGLLQNDRRRHVLEILQNGNGQSLRAISEKIATIESDNENDKAKSSVRKSIYVSLLQTHIPKMEKMGIITHNREKDIIELTSRAQDLNMYLETVKKGDIPWSHFYMGLGIFALAGNAAVEINAINWISGSQWAFFVGILLLLSSIAHVTHTVKLED